MSEQVHYSLELITPKGVAVSEDVSFSKIPGISGEMGIMPSHSASLTLLRAGELMIRPANGEEQRYFIPEGMAHVLENKVKLVVPYMEKVSEIDKGRAESAWGRAQKRLKQESNESELDLARAKRAFDRAEARIGLLLNP